MNFEGEKLSTKFYKYILGVHKRATNLAVIGDLGRTPYLLTLFTPYNLALSFLLTAGHDTDGCRKNGIYVQKCSNNLCNIYRHVEFWSGVLLL